MATAVEQTGMTDEQRAACLAEIDGMKAGINAVVARVEAMTAHLRRP